MSDNNKNFKLEKKIDLKCNAKFLIVVMDGVGYIDTKNNINFPIENHANYVPSAAFSIGNAVNAAYTPNLLKLYQSKYFRTLKAHGHAVGLPSEEDMGNSEVGHNAIGSGRIYAQGAKLVNAAIQSGEIFKGETWAKCVERAELKSGKNTLHLCGLLSDGNVHSHIHHLFALIEGAKKSGVQKVRLHMLLDGRDVPPLSALDYVQQLDQFLSQVVDAQFDCQVASGGGRTFVTMDRYESDWSIVERGYQAHVLGEGRQFSNLTQAIETYRAEKNYFDQDLPSFVISKEEKPLGPVADQDSFIFFNFRGDRAIEISRALTEENFSAFPRKFFPKIHYAGMMQYDGDLKIPSNYLVTPPFIESTMTELLSKQNVKQFACSETQKYGHVTYFWNGNRTEKFNAQMENYVEIPSDKVPFSQRPWMKCAEITDVTIDEMRKESFQIGRINFANGDMVGHTGDFASSIVAISAVDICLGRLMEAAKETNTILIVTADHGNADEMFEIDKKKKQVNFGQDGKPKPKTSHTLSPVPFSIFNAEILPFHFEFKENLPDAGLANIAATVLEMAGFEAPKFYEPSLIEIKSEKSKENSDKSVSLFSSEAEKTFLTALDYAVEISKKAETLGFCWPTIDGVFGDIENEVKELKEEVLAKTVNYERISDEIGDVVFSLANLVTFLDSQGGFPQKLHLEMAAKQSVEKFLVRFYEMEKILQEKGQVLNLELAKSLSVDEWMDLWKEAKRRRYR